MNLYLTCPNLQHAVWKIKSPLDDLYQCIAWAACRIDDSLWPTEGYWWFPGLPRVQEALEAPVSYFIEGFGTLGYRPCTSGLFEFGYQKVAIFANDAGVTHMARQHFWGRWWLSKIGDKEDILHKDLRDVEGAMLPEAYQYGSVAQILKRSWWFSIINFCVFRSIWHTAKHFYCRLTHPYWDTAVPTR
ncbi:MAG: hypothetical protein WB997_05750 [Candidatus Acidiferrales bacterium]